MVKFAFEVTILSSIMGGRFWAALSAWFALVLLVSPASALYDGMYCGKINCYDLLNVTREVPKKDVCLLLIRCFACCKTQKLFALSSWGRSAEVFCANTILTRIPKYPSPSGIFTAQVWVRLEARSGFMPFVKPSSLACVCICAATCYCVG